MIETLFTSPWLDLKQVVDKSKGIKGYVFSHESSCQGKKVAVLPYRYNPEIHTVEFLVKSEVTPCWSLYPVMSAVTGGYEGGSLVDDAVRETLEETGFDIAIEDLEYLGTCYASKSADTIYSLFAVDVTGLEQGEALGDGTRLESEAKTYWMDIYNASTIMDAQFGLMVLRLALKLGLLLDSGHDESEEVPVP